MTTYIGNKQICDECGEVITRNWSRSRTPSGLHFCSQECKDAYDVRDALEAMEREERRPLIRGYSFEHVWLDDMDEAE